MGEIASHAQNPDLESAYKAFVRYMEQMSEEWTAEQVEIGKEIERRLKRLENDSNRLITINNQLLDAEGFKMYFDEATGTVTYEHKGMSRSVRVNRANPDTPVKLTSSTTQSSYVAGGPDKVVEEDDELRMQMEQILEAFYGTAFRITKLVQKITPQKKFECREITIVRNKLLEHAEAGSIYSFGYSSNGPVVKPIRRGQRQWTDAGLTKNATALNEALVAVFTKGV